jgi:hypothetical protein
VAGSFLRGSAAIFGDTSTSLLRGSRPDMIARAASFASSPSTVPGSIPTSRSPLPAHSSDRSAPSSRYPTCRSRTCSAASGSEVMTVSQPAPCFSR